MSTRLNRFLAQSGFGSRRACDQFIRDGRVSINGKVVTDLSTQVGEGDQVKLGSRLARNVAATNSITAMLNKPKGFLCTADDPEGRRTIYDLLPPDWPRVFYVGRLDVDSEGLLIVTNDGELSQRLTHPSYKLPKTYEVTLDREFDFSTADKLRKGVLIEGKKARVEEIHHLGGSSVKVVLMQGIKRQIRLMFLYLGYKVRRLLRTEIGKLKLDRLPSGQWKMLTEKDVARYLSPQKAAPLKTPIKAARSFGKPAGRGKPQGDSYKKTYPQPLERPTAAASEDAPSERPAPRSFAARPAGTFKKTGSKTDGPRRGAGLEARSGRPSGGGGAYRSFAKPPAYGSEAPSSERPAPRSFAARPAGTFKKTGSKTGGPRRGAGSEARSGKTSSGTYRSKGSAGKSAPRRSSR